MLLRMKFLTTIVAIVALSSCAGLSARQEILMPAMQIAWVNVAKDCERGIQFALDSSDITPVQAAVLRSEIIAMDSALAARDILRVADVNWHRLNQLARSGIGIRYDNDLIGYNVKAILLKRLDKFHEAYIALVKSL